MHHLPNLHERLQAVTDRLDEDALQRGRRFATAEHAGMTIERPAEATSAHAWDIAAGRLDQHRTAFGSDLAQATLPIANRSGITASTDRVTGALQSLPHARVTELDAGIDIGR